MGHRSDDDDDDFSVGAEAAASNPNYRLMTTAERVACGGLCACLAVAVMSAVAMVYSTVIVYIPARAELAYGLGQEPVMCHVVETRHIRGDMGACRWSSCSEWCLSRGGADCTHIFVSVRANGSSVDLEECRDVTERFCPSLDLDKVPKANCKEDFECAGLHGIFVCNDGTCANITSVQTCRYEPRHAEAPVSCEKKRNCVELSGTYDCKFGRCARLHQWTCERRCGDLPFTGRNVILQTGDRLVLGSCARAIDRTTGEAVWTEQNRRRKGSYENQILYAACTKVVTGAEVITAEDCLNGTLLDWTDVQPATNYTKLVQLVDEGSRRGRIDPANAFLPFEADVTIFPRSRLTINTEGCVNTLKDECQRFYAEHSKDGRNSSSPARFPCHYAPAKPQVAVRYFNPAQTKWRFMVFFLVPAAALTLSCCSLLACSRILTVDSSGQMALSCCNKDSSHEIDREPLERRGRKSSNAEDL